MFNKKKNGIRNFFLIETPKKCLLKKIWRHPEINQGQVVNFKNYCDAADNDDGIKIEYSKMKKYGRWYIKNTNMISSCPMWGVLRNILFSETEDDIDIVAAHQSILYDILKAKGSLYKTDKLKEYLDDREHIFNDIQIEQEAINRYNETNNDNKEKRDFCKLIFTILIYGGTLETWVFKCEFEEDDYKLTPFIKEFITELNENINILLLIDKRFKEIIDWKKSDHLKDIKKKYIPIPEDKKEKKRNINYFDIKKYHIKNGALLSIILQEYECKIVEEAMNFANKDFTITSYNYDGFQIKKTDDNIVDNLNEYISKLDFKDEIKWNNIKFIKKSFKGNLDLSKIVEEMDEFDYDEFRKIKDYKYSKWYFEKFHFKSLNPSEYVKIFPDGKLQHCAHDKFMKMYRHMKSYYFKQEFGYGIWSFIDKWLDDEDMKHYTEIGFYPKPLICPYNHFNMWCDFPIERVELIGKPNTKIIYDHFMLMANNDELVYNYLLNWFAHIVKKPGRKTEVCLVFFGEERTGKSFIAERILEKIIGEARIFITGKCDKAFGKHSDLQGKLLVVLNEAGSNGDTHQIADVLKDCITANKTQLEKKCIDIVEIKDFCNFVFTTNRLNSIKMSKGDSRFMPIAVDNSKCSNKEYFDPLYAAVEDKQIMRQFYDELMSRDINKFHPSNDRVETDLSRILKKVNIDYIEDFVEYCIIQKFFTWYKPQGIYDEFRNWWDLQGRKIDQRPSQPKFLGMMMFCTGCEKRRMGFGNQYKIKKRTNLFIDDKN